MTSAPDVASRDGKTPGDGVPVLPGGPAPAAAGDSRTPLSGAVREFNRFYTNVLGLLRGGYLRTSYSLTEARVVFEIAQRGAGTGSRTPRAPGPSAPAPRRSAGAAQQGSPDAAGRPGTDAAELRRVLDLDAGYLSRVLARFEADGLISRERSGTDARRNVITLTPAGRGVFEILDQRAEAQAQALLSPLRDEDRRRLTGAMAAIREILQGPERRGPGFVLRAPLPGDLGWVVQRNAAIYHDEYGWDQSYEALVARIVAGYAGDHDPRREAAWIAEADGEPAGCVFCMSDSATVARLRLLLVEPHARGLGLGSLLVAECIRFAKRAGYTEMVLWTNDVLVDARRIYEKAGFTLTESQPHHSFGHDLVGQTWRLPLT